MSFEADLTAAAEDEMDRAMTLGWAYFDLPLGPHATVHYTPPAGLLDP